MPKSTRSDENREVFQTFLNSFCSEDFPFVAQKNSYQDGYDLGMFLAEHVGGTGEVGILAGSLTATDHVERIKGFKNALAGFPDMSIVFEQPDNDVLEEAVTLTENALRAHPNLVGLFGSNASNPIGAARAVFNAGLAGKVAIVGMDDLPVGYRLLDNALYGGDEPEPHLSDGSQHRLAVYHQS